MKRRNFLSLPQERQDMPFTDNQMARDRPIFQLCMGRTIATATPTLSG